MTAGWVVFGVGMLGVAATVVPFVPSNGFESGIFRAYRWPSFWRRCWPALRSRCPCVGAQRSSSPPEWAAALGWQVIAILPYTPIFPTEAKATARCQPESRICLLVANVLKSSREIEPLLSLVGRLGPDVVILVETNAWWDEQLDPLKDSYQHFVPHPQDNGYGMHLFSRFELIGPEVRFLIDDYVPPSTQSCCLPRARRSISTASIRSHRRLQDTARRDAELMVVGREVRKEAAPAIVAGDLNDVMGRPCRLRNEGRR